MEPITYESKAMFFYNELNTNIMRMRDTILDTAAEAGIYKSWRILYNHSTCNTFTNGKYLSSIRDDPDGKYLQVHFNA